MTLIGAGMTPLRVETTPLDSSFHLRPLTDPHHPLFWYRAGEGMTAQGEAVRLEFSGPHRIREAAQAWRALSAAAQVQDSVGRPGTGLIAFGAFAFSQHSPSRSVLIVPRTVVGNRGGRWWLTQIAPIGSALPEMPKSRELERYVGALMMPGVFADHRYREAVASAVTAIRSGALEKVVLALDMAGSLPRDAELRYALSRLALNYPDCWTFAVDGFIGASPETLVSVDHGTVTARVLAGTAARGRTEAEDVARAQALLASPKDYSEHSFALDSLLSALRPHTRTLSTSTTPFALELPNLWHLATDVSGTLGDASTALDLVDVLHPTAAVAGTPTDRALDLLEELEPLDRGRYAGPVGWIDGNGDGEWAVGLRSAEVSANGIVTAWAGAGIVADSDPEAELVETGMKFRPILDAFG
nr:isochorismate synthase [Rathayibacter toxicus]